MPLVTQNVNSLLTHLQGDAKALQRADRVGRKVRRVAQRELARIAKAETRKQGRK